MADPTIKDLAYRGLASVLGGPVDLASMVMRPFGYNVPEQQVVGGSEWIGKQLEDVGLISSARAPVQEFITSMAIPTPSGLAKGAALGGAALVGAVKGSGKTADALKKPAVIFSSVSDDPYKWSLKNESFKKNAQFYGEPIGGTGEYVFVKDKRIPDYSDFSEIIVLDKNKNVVGDVGFGLNEKGKLEAAIEIAPEHRRKKIATALYDKIEEMSGQKLSPAESNTPLARAFWESRLR